MLAGPIDLGPHPNPGGGTGGNGGKFPNLTSAASTLKGREVFVCFSATRAPVPS